MARHRVSRLAIRNRRAALTHVAPDRGRQRPQGLRSSHSPLGSKHHRLRSSWEMVTHEVQQMFAPVDPTFGHNTDLSRIHAARKTRHVPSTRCTIMCQGTDLRDARRSVLQIIGPPELAQRHHGDGVVLTQPRGCLRRASAIARSREQFLGTFNHVLHARLREQVRNHMRRMSASQV